MIARQVRIADRMGRRTITLLCLFLLAGGPHSSFAQESQQASRSTPYRIGIFPGAGDFSVYGGGGADQGVARVVQTNIQRDRTLTLAYSHYDEVLNEPRIKNRDRLWVGGQVKKKPNAEVVYRLARERGLDGVIMWWTGGSGIAYSDSRAIDLYLIDVERRQVDRKKGTNKKSDVDKLIRKMLAQFLDGRPQVMQAKAGAAIEPVAAKPQLVISPLTEAEGGTSHADTIYREGYRFSVQQDHTKAVMWYRTAAEEGHAGAQYNLGAAYANGTGVSADKETAVDWFFKAGQAFLKEGKHGSARQALDAIERVAPGHVLGQRLRAAIQQSQ